MCENRWLCRPSQKLMTRLVHSSVEATMPLSLGRPDGRVGLGRGLLGLAGVVAWPVELQLIVRHFPRLPVDNDNGL